MGSPEEKTSDFSEGGVGKKKKIHWGQNVQPGEAKGKEKLKNPKI